MTAHHHRWYASTACQHGDHAYCQAYTGPAGSKKPAQCKFCELPCVCTCHSSDPDPSIPADPALADLRRELRKALGVLGQCETYLARHAEMNAALHCASDGVVHSPLHAAVTLAMTAARHALGRTAPGPVAAPEDGG